MAAPIARRFSPLTQITPDNVGKLERAWLVHTGDLPSERAEGTYGAENTPLKIGDSLYVCTPQNIMISLDPATGKHLWRFDPNVPDEVNRLEEHTSELQSLMSKTYAVLCFKNKHDKT